mmetsp:Transcript_7962/g.33505  ORF Transcript_7962/g.33505 Transcript_7962/m.33505 type:complete len:1022 (+) Transcript_7962:842-3907(+)
MHLQLLRVGGLVQVVALDRKPDVALDHLHDVRDLAVNVDGQVLDHVVVLHGHVDEHALHGLLLDRGRAGDLLLGGLLGLHLLLGLQHLLGHLVLLDGLHLLGSLLGEVLLHGDAENARRAHVVELPDVLHGVPCGSDVERLASGAWGKRDRHAADRPVVAGLARVEYDVQMVLLALDTDKVLRQPDGHARDVLLDGVVRLHGLVVVMHLGSGPEAAHELLTGRWRTLDVQLGLQHADLEDAALRGRCQIHAHLVWVDPVVEAARHHGVAHCTEHPLVAAPPRKLAHDQCLAADGVDDEASQRLGALWPHIGELDRHQIGHRRHVRNLLVLWPHHEEQGVDLLADLREVDVYFLDIRASGALGLHRQALVERIVLLVGDVVEEHIEAIREARAGEMLLVLRLVPAEAEDEVVATVDGDGVVGENVARLRVYVHHGVDLRLPVAVEHGREVVVASLDGSVLAGNRCSVDVLLHHLGAEAVVRREAVLGLDLDAGVQLLGLHRAQLGGRQNPRLALLLLLALGRGELGCLLVLAVALQDSELAEHVDLVSRGRIAHLHHEVALVADREAVVLRRVGPMDNKVGVEDAVLRVQRPAGETTAVGDRLAIHEHVQNVLALEEHQVLDNVRAVLLVLYLRGPAQRLVGAGLDFLQLLAFGWRGDDEIYAIAAERVLPAPLVLGLDQEAGLLVELSHVDLGCRRHVLRDVGDCARLVQHLLGCFLERDDEVRRHEDAMLRLAVEVLGLLHRSVVLAVGLDQLDANPSALLELGVADVAHNARAQLGPRRDHHLCALLQALLRRECRRWEGLYRLWLRLGGGLIGPEVLRRCRRRRRRRKGLLPLQLDGLVLRAILVVEERHVGHHALLHDLGLHRVAAVGVEHLRLDHARDAELLFAHVEGLVQSVELHVREVGDEALQCLSIHEVAGEVVDLLALLVVHPSLQCLWRLAWRVAEERNLVLENDGPQQTHDEHTVAVVDILGADVLQAEGLRVEAVAASSKVERCREVGHAVGRVLGVVVHVPEQLGHA